MQADADGLYRQISSLKEDAPVPQAQSERSAKWYQLAIELRPNRVCVFCAAGP